MRGSHLEHEDNIGEVIFKIIEDYPSITTMDIWLELGEDDRYKGIISRAEVNDLLSQLEKQKIIKRDEEGKWRIK